MMQDLMMHLLELITNSIAANAKHIVITLVFSNQNNRISFSVQDDGKGMDEETCKIVKSPFTTSRTTRKVGLGLAFLQGLCELCFGNLQVTSTLGVGTRVAGDFQKDCIDAPPLGNVGETMMIALQNNANVEYSLTLKTDHKEFTFDTTQIKEILNGVEITDPTILVWIRDYINEQINTLKEEIE